MIVSAAGNLEHAHVRDLVAEAFATLSTEGEAVAQRPPTVRPSVLLRTKELEQSHICLGANSYQQNHDDRYVSYILNSVLGGSMSSRLFQNVREKRGLAYSVFSGMRPTATREHDDSRGLCGRCRGSHRPLGGELRAEAHAGACRRAQTRQGPLRAN
jgi:predicted Zn-dependent peptidase